MGGEEMGGEEMGGEGMGGEEMGGEEMGGKEMGGKSTFQRERLHFHTHPPRSEPLYASHYIHTHRKVDFEKKLRTFWPIS